MKILILFKRWKGGVGSAVKSLSKEFEKRGHEVIAISREDDFGINSFLKSISPLRNKIKEIVERENIDIIYTQDWSLAFPFLFPTTLFENKHFCVFYGINPPFLLPLQKLTGRLMGKKIIVCINKLKEMFPKSTLIYNRVDPELFKPNKKVKKVKDSVGLASWRVKEYHFEEIKKAIEDAGKKIIIAENIPKEKMPKFFQKLESFINLPPKCSGFGLAYLESMASGVPKIIGSNYGGGGVLPITKIEDYKDIKTAILNAEKKDYRKWILGNKFTWADAVKELEKLFKDSQKDEKLSLVIK